MFGRCQSVFDVFIGKFTTVPRMAVLLLVLSSLRWGGTYLVWKHLFSHMNRRKANSWHTDVKATHSQRLSSLQSPLTDWACSSSSSSSKGMLSLHVSMYLLLALALAYNLAYFNWYSKRSWIWLLAYNWAYLNWYWDLSLIIGLQLAYNWAYLNWYSEFNLELDLKSECELERECEVKYELKCGFRM